MTIGTMRFGTLNTAGKDETTLESDNASTLLVENGVGTALTGRALQVGVRGYGDPVSGTGVIGQGKIGVSGTGHPQHGHGVVGEGSVGVFGAGTRAGVQGDSPTQPGGGDGVVGRSTNFGQNGVLGQHFGNGVGVRGRCDNGFGMYARSKTQVGVGGECDSGYAVQGLSSTGLAGAFYGRTVVVGSFEVHGSLTVIPPGAKSMAARHPDGSYRRLYALESPQSWIEDFGSARLADGHARVDLDLDYVAIAEMADYHVFLTPEGDCNGLYVTNKEPTGFEVREQRAGKSALQFSYRVVAPPKAVEGGPRGRLERVDVARPEPVEVPTPSTTMAEDSPPDAPS
jgi:hypothetical protein